MGRRERQFMRRDFRRFWKHNNPFSEGMLVPSTITLKNINDIDGVLDDRIYCEIVLPSAPPEFNAFTKATSEMLRLVHVTSAMARSEDDTRHLRCARARPAERSNSGNHHHRSPARDRSIRGGSDSSDRSFETVPSRKSSTSKSMKIDDPAIYCAAIKKT